VNTWIHIAILALVIGAVFGYLWWQGQVQRLAAYVAETQEELKKCAWPSWEELKGSTALIIIMVALLSGFVVLVDLAFYNTGFSPFKLAVVSGVGYAVWHFLVLKRQ
jgi:preprotein translocase SecE subunit